jgi:hypothetical protein
MAAALAVPAGAQDQQPHMQAALQALKTAQRELAQAEKDKGGHRERAQRLIVQAIAQVEAGMHYDTAHDKKKK